jgi:2-oxoglutarate-Fe(II)-dependent oxygenase superfamily protein
MTHEMKLDSTVHPTFVFCTYAFHFQVTMNLFPAQNTQYTISPTVNMADQEDSRLTRRKIKASLQKALSEVKYPGSFLTSRSFENAINPGLDVLGVGPISLPLSAEVVNKIIQASHVSPYGKGSQTLVDDSVRKSWELNADQFFLRNPAWAKQIESLLKEAVPGLGLMAELKEIRAEIYKLVLYEEGAFFLPHQDSEKADGMFGTLVVSLPSKHEGGDVVASHKGESRTFSSSPGSDFGFSYAAWYSDVTHEVKPVTSGYRIVLTYNLIHRPSAMLLRDRLTTGLVSLLESWTGLCEEVFPTPDQPVKWLAGNQNVCPTALLYMLDHKYTYAELSFARLKGADQARVAEVRKACEQTGFPVFLANIEKSQSGSVFDYRDISGSRWNDDAPHCLEEITETNLVLSDVVEPDDHTLATEVNIRNDDKMFVQDDPFNDDPDDEDFGGYTGNEGATATHFYRRTVKKTPSPHCVFLNVLVSQLR